MGWFRYAVVAAVALSAAARAEPVDSPAYGFSAVFPCTSATTSQVVSTPSGAVTMSIFVCQNAAGSFFVSVSDTPKGSVTDANREAVLAGAVAGIAANLKGTVRTAEPLTGGRDVVIDLGEQKASAHARVFLAHDRLYQAMAFVATGKEAAKETLEFLNSFKLK